MAIVCQCIPVRDRAVIKAIQHGAATLVDVQATCGAATQCGGCEPAIQALLQRHAKPVTDPALSRTMGAPA